MFSELKGNQIEEKRNFISNFIGARNAADGSAVDANSNVTQKTMATLEAELYKDYTIQLNRKLVYDKLETLYNKDIADKYLDDLTNHLIYTHDESSTKPYCASISMYPFLLEGTKCIGGVSGAPKNLQSYNGSFVNFVYQVASDFAGAVATVEYLHIFDWFARNQYGDNYLDTNKKAIAQEFQGTVYALNQPASARGNQSVFWNISVFDNAYMKSMFGDFYYPDGTKVNFDSVMKLQKFFMEWFREEREKELLTFPVLTASVLEKEDGTGFVDEEFVSYCAKEMSKGLSFFVYQSKSADSLSSCCFDGSQLVLTKSSDGVNYMSFEDLFKAPFNETKRNFTIFHNGSWVKGKVVRLSKASHEMYKIVTVNNKEMVLTDNHINVTYTGDKRTDMLTEDDYIMFNTDSLGAVPERDLHLTYEQGALIGAYLGDGSKSAGYNQVDFSLNADKYKTLLPILEKALSDCRIDTKIRLGKIYNNVYPVSMNSKELKEFISYWVKGNYCYEKSLNMNCLLQSEDFRKGVLDGYYMTDGGNSNRIYTTSAQLVNNVETLITSLGRVSVINISDRTDEPAIIRGKEYKHNFPLYCIRWYNRNNKRELKNVYKVRLNQTFFKIKSIEKVETNDNYVYCFEMTNDDEPYFTLPNGIITHNCRLKNELADNDFSYTLGAGGVITGSSQVITINFNRLFQRYNGFEELPELVDRLHKYLTAFKSLYTEYIDAGLLPTYTAGIMDIDKQFVTIGINGVVEAAEYLNISPRNNDEYKKFLKKSLNTIKEKNTAYRLATGIKVNTEYVPAENLGVKNAKWDKKDGLAVNRDCYNSYFYVVEDTQSTILDKMSLHGNDVTAYLDGGSALHANFSHLLSETQFYKLFHLAEKHGVPYWTFNVKMTCCESCGYIDVETKDSCSKCGSHDIHYATRVIGYLKPISKFSSNRQEEEGLRYYM